MQVIETKYHGPTDHYGSRVSARNSSAAHGRRIMLSWDSALTHDGNHKAAALALKRKLSWQGVMYGGSTERGMVFVFADDDNRIE